MATPKPQPSRAIAVIPSNVCDIPMPEAAVTSVATSATGTTLTDSAVDFVAKGIRPGFTLYSATSGSAAIVKSVATHVLTLETTITVGAADAYQVYASTGNNDGCVLYVGIQGDLAVLTAAGDTVTFVGIVGFVPVNVKRVLTASSAAAIIALW